jgi:hypothetical protein
VAVDLPYPYFFREGYVTRSARQQVWVKIAEGQDGARTDYLAAAEGDNVDTIILFEERRRCGGGENEAWEEFAGSMGAEVAEIESLLGSQRGLQGKTFARCSGRRMR